MVATGAWALSIGYTPLAIGQLLLAGGFYWISLRLNLHDQASIARFYQGFWVLFFCEYGVFGMFG
jgi:homogentisate phytyltransferase/homogentisate geranylgeranyltransferase